ncbi:MAG: hypothetical protein ACRD0U_17295, partial [Acidimicrobiales bacterium]
MTTLFPVVLCIDVEPDARVPDGRRPAALDGFDALLKGIGPLRELVAAESGQPARFTWCLRMDPQIAECYGSAAALAHRYEHEFADLVAAGDEIGLHPHCGRWVDGAWVADHADSGWVQHCAGLALRSYDETFGHPCAAYRQGDRFMSTALANQLDVAGIAVDLTVEPGFPAMRGLAPGETTTGWLPDTRGVPGHAYRPSPGDFRAPDPDRDDGLLMVPLTRGGSPSTAGEAGGTLS